MDARTILEISLLLSMTVASTPQIIVNGTTYYDTYIYDVLQSGRSLVLTCQEAGRVPAVWNSSVTGPISPNTNVSIYGVTITNVGGTLRLNTFTSALSGVYTCSINNTLVSSILLTTSNPSLNILSQLPAKLYNEAMQFQLLMSSYYIRDGILQSTPPDSIQYYDAALRENITVEFNATMTAQGPYQITVFLRDAVLSTFFILVDVGNDSSIEMSFTLTKVALYLSPIPTEIIALVGDKITIDCSPSDPAITVRIEFYPSGNQDRQVVSNDIYNIISVMESNSGNYTCSGFAPSSITLLTNDLILTETVHIIVLPDPVAIEFNRNIVTNVSIINIDTNSATLTCLGTKGNSRLQWGTYNYDDTNSNMRNTYQILGGKDGVAEVTNENLTIINSANKTILIIQNVNRYSGSFLYCTSMESGKKAFTLITQANPFVIAHPDLPPDAALGQSFEMMFVVGFNSNGKMNDLSPLGTATSQITLSLNSTVVNTAEFSNRLPYTLQNQVPISTVSEGNYTLAVEIPFLEEKAEASIYLFVIVPSISFTSSPMNVLQSTLVNLSCVPSDKRAPIVWQYSNISSEIFNDIIDESPFNVGYNGYWLSFYTVLKPASFQEFNLPSLPNSPTPSPKISFPYLQTQGSNLFRCSLINGTTEKVFSEHIRLNTLRDTVQMVVTFMNRTMVTLFNDTTINNGVQIAMLDCLVLSGMGTPTLKRRRFGVDQLLQPGIAVGNTSILVSSTQVSISVRTIAMNPDITYPASSYLYGYYQCSVSNGNISIVNITEGNYLFTNEGSSVINQPLGSIGLVYFQLAVSCNNGLNNAAFSNLQLVRAVLQSYSLNEIIQITLSQNDSSGLFALYVVGPTTLVLYINPVTQINAGVYSIISGLDPVLTAAVTLNTKVPVLSVLQSQVDVHQFQTTQITCIPSQDGVQIQWTFLSTNMVLYTGYEHTYTIVKASPFDEGTYMCSVYGTDSRIVTPQSVYVNVIAVCPTNYTAGVVWESAFENQTVLMPCSDADPKFSPVTQMSQQCLPSGQWAMVDYSKCTLQSGVNRPFTLYWSSLLDEVTFELERSFRGLIPGINITYKPLNFSSIFPGSSRYAVIISASFSDQQLINYYPFTPGQPPGLRRKRTLDMQLSYATIRPSDPCRCKQGFQSDFYLCSNVLSSPCSCINSTQCQCVPPFVGDGEFCTVDSDLDGIPDHPLNCTGYTYCVQDNCPYTYNPPIEGIQSDVCNGKLIDGCRPTNDTIWDLQWPSVPVNFTYVQPCPNGGINNVSGNTSRFCSGTGNWGPTDVTQCESYTYRYLAQQVLDSNLKIPQGLYVIAFLYNYTQPQAVSILPLDLKNSVIIISTILNLLTTSLQQGRITDVKDTVIVLDVINNLLNETNLMGWQILQTINPNTAISLLLSSAESYGLYVASAINTTMSISLSRSSIVLQASNVKITPNQADIKFPGGINDLFANASFSSSDASIVLPGALLLERANKASSVPVVNMIIKNINMFLPINTSISQLQVDSLILSSQVAVKDGGFTSLALKTRPVSIIFRINNPKNATSQYQCSFWNFTNSSWSSDGMLSPSSNGSFVQCYSTHLTSFAVLLAVAKFPDSEALTIISYIGCGISMASLLCTIIFFLTFRKQLLEKPHNFIHLNLAIALFLAFLVFVAGVETAKNNEAACKAVAALLQYFWLSAFCWMLCEGVMLYLMLILVFSTLKNKWWFFFLLGWLPPLVFVVIGLAVRSDYYVVRGNDRKTISYCWMSTAEGTIWAFAVPVILVMLANAVVLVMVLVVLFRNAKPKSDKAKLSKDNRSAVIYLIKSSIILLPVLGCTWMFGLLSVNKYTLVFTWLFTILNSLQGFFIFVCYVLRHEKIWGRISKKYASWYTSSQSGESKSGKSNIYADVKTSTTGQSQKEDKPNRSNIYTDAKSSIIMEHSENEDVYHRYTDLKRMDQSEKIIRGGSVYDVVLKKVKMDATQCVELPTLEEFDIVESTLTTFVDPKQ